MKKIGKRIISTVLALVLLLTLTLILPGCSKSEQAAPSTDTKSAQPAAKAEEKKPETKNDQPVNLKLWVFADQHAKFFEYVKEEFKKKSPNVTVDVELNKYDALYDKLRVVMSSGGEGAPDLVDVEQGIFGSFVKSGSIFEPLNNYLQKSGKTQAISKGRQDLYTWDGKIYGLEHALCPVVLAYRKDVFEEAGIQVPIKTWNEYKEAAKKLKSGVYMMGVGALPGAVKDRVDLICRSAKADITDEKGSPAINTPTWIEANKMLHDWVKKDKIATTFEGDNDHFKLIGQGKIVTMIAADWGTGWLKDFVPEQSGKWAVMPLPTLHAGDPNTSVWGGTGLAIVNNSKHKDIAWEFMALAQLNKQSAVKRFELTNLFPPLLEAFDAPELNKPNEYYGGQVLGKVYAELGAIAPAQRPCWWNSLYKQAYEKYYFDFDTGKLSAEDLAKKVDEELKALIEKNK